MNNNKQYATIRDNNNSTRDYELAERIARLPDDCLIGSRELAALTGFALISIQQRRVSNLPPSDPRYHRLTWRLGNIRDWMRQESKFSLESSKSEEKHETKKKGRPTKSELIARGAR